MLEDPHPMDHKKTIRANPSGPTNSNSDQRLNAKQDVAVAKSTRPPRFSDSGNRRRSGGADNLGYGESRGPSKRGQIKRPLPRSFPSKTNYPDDNSEHPMTQADEFEVGSVFNQGSKKQNYNHLLNFNFEPRGYTAQRSRGASRPNQRNRNEPMKRRPKYSKELYLQANCQFVVREGENYESHLHDADDLVDWNFIEQVNLKTTADVPSCPICLYPPTAAKITRCGHVFCWSCILHYLSLSDHTWRKCPICDESIYRQDLKSVVSIAWKEFQIGDEIEMYLMRRERNSLFALPVDSYFPEVNDKHPNISARSNYSQLVTASPSQVAMHIIAREKHELEAQYRSDQNEPESCFIEEALQYVSERENGIVLDQSFDDVTPLTPLDEERTIFEDNSDCLETSDLPDIENEQDSESAVHQRHTSCSSDSTIAEGADSPTEVTAEDLDISQAEDNSRKYSIEDGKNGNAPKSTFYFYQSSDGQPIFLHAINVQMFVKEFGAFENCPKVIRGKIVEKDGASMTQELRNKLRYLKHLPVTSSFEVCELEMSSPKFSKEVLEEFQPQLDARRRRRQRREREEKRRDKQITIELNKTVMGQYPDPKLRIESSFHFPEVGSSQAIARSTESLASIDSTLSTSPSAWGPGASSSSSMSFAKMLRQGGPRPSAPIPKPSGPPTQPQYVTLTPSVTRPRLVSGDDSEPDPEDYVPPPPKANIGDVLAMALERSTIQESENANSGGKKKGKKMKGKMISLTGGGGRTAFN